LTITAAIREIGRYHRAGRIDREELRSILEGLKNYYLSIYRCLGAFEACACPDACPLDDDLLEARLEDLCQCRGRLAEALQPIVVRGEMGRG